MKRNMRRKVLVIPFVKLTKHKSKSKKSRTDKGNIRLLVAKDQDSGDWTFFSGTCEPYEHPIRCALRELYEETRGVVRLQGLPRNTRRIRLHCGRDTRVDIFFVPLEVSCQRGLDDIIKSFNRRSGGFPEEFFENERIAFETLAQFKRHRHVWAYIRDIMGHWEFQKAIGDL